MAIYHFHVKVGSRAKGQSAAAKARYILRQGKFKKDKDEVLFSMSGNMPAWAAASPLKYWKAADSCERANGLLFREMDLALPVELDLPQKIQLAKKIAVAAAEGRMPYTMGLHHGRGNNPHLHLMLSERLNDGHRRTPETWFRRAAPAGNPPETGGARKADIGSQRKPWLEQIRARWAEMANEALAAAGFSAKIDHRSLEAQGVDRFPQVHMGPNVIELEQKGLPTDRADRALVVAEANRQLDELAQIEKEIHDEQQRLGASRKSPQSSTANRGPGEATPASRPENSQAGKGIGEDGQSPEKAPATSSAAAKPTRPTSRPMIPPQEGGPDMQQRNNTLAHAFQAGVESRKRQREWEKQRAMLLHPPTSSLTYEQIERRRDLAKRWDWLMYPQDVRRRAVEASRQGGEALRRIEERQREAREAAFRAECQAREIREQIPELKPLQFFEKSRLGAKLLAAEQSQAEAKAEQKRFALAEKQLLSSCPAEVVERYQYSKEEERARALAELLQRETQEIEEERRQEAAEAQARKDRMSMRPAAKPEKPGGWAPPSPG